MLILQEILQGHLFLMSQNFEMQGWVANGRRQTD